MKRVKLISLVAVLAILALTMLSSSSVPAGCECNLADPHCGCCPEYNEGGTTWYLVGWECWGVNGVCTHRHCVYM